jgi:hypothetical protein
MSPLVAVDDDGDDDTAAVVDHSIAAAIRADLAARNRQVERITHPDAPKWTVTYRLPTDRTELAPFFARQEKAEKRRQEYHFDAAVLATFAESILFLDAPPVGAGPCTFRDSEVIELLGATSPTGAVRAMYASDGIVSSIAARLISAAGYGSTDELLVDDAPDPSRPG